MQPTPRASRLALRSVSLLSLALLAACGGGGGGSGGGLVSTPAPAPAPAPAPSPATPAESPTSGMPQRQPVVAEFDTAEFRRSDGPAEHNAASAWSAGYTGSGVTIAIVDTGVDVDGPEFAGRISPFSTDVTGAGRPVSGADSHGTNVALVAAAGRNGSGILGMAFDATILAIRADAAGSCDARGADGSGGGCLFNDADMAGGVNHAAANGAGVINVSLAGEGASIELRNAARAAADAGSLLVLAAGNAGHANPDGLAAQLANAALGGAIIVGSIKSDGSMADLSNRAGSSADHFLVALGDRICCAYEDGQLLNTGGFNYYLSGTSFAAPQVSGAAALLAQAFPNLTGRQIADILLRSAFDAGAPGTDPIFGRGILDVARAFQPLGATALAGSNAHLALGDITGAASPAMGDAFAAASLPTLVTDAYDRAFKTDLAGTLTGAQVRERLRGAVEAGTRQVSLASDVTTVAFSVDDRDRTGESEVVGHEKAERVRSARVTSRPAPGLGVGFAYGYGAQGLVTTLQGQDGPAFLIAPDTADEAGAARSADLSLALRRQLGRWGLTLSAERGETWSGAAMLREAEMTGRRVAEDVATYGVTFDRRFGELEAAAGLSWMNEERTLLGGRFHDAFGLTGSDTLFLDARAGWRFASGWRLGAALRQGRTSAEADGFVAGRSTLVSQAWSLDLERRGVFGSGDALAVRLSQPLRVERGALNLNLPVAYSYDTLSAELSLRSLSLAPQGRELLAELAWHGPLLSGSAAASLFYRRDPGHYASLPSDEGVALRWAKQF